MNSFFRLRKFAVLAGAAALSLGTIPGCGSDSGGSKGGASNGDAGDGGDGGKSGGSASGGRGSGAGGAGQGGVGTPSGGAGGIGVLPVECGGETCEPPDQSGGLQAYACCTAADACGIRVPLTAKCLAKKQPGKIDPLCLPYELPTKITLPGCCSPSGCGALGTFQNVGCIPNQDLGKKQVDCDYDRTGGGTDSGSGDAGPDAASVPDAGPPGDAAGD